MRWSVLGMNVVFQLAVFSSVSSGALLMTNDGATISCVLDHDQSLSLESKSGLCTFPLSDVVWLVGEEVATAAVSGRTELIRGRIVTTVIQAHVDDKTFSVPTDSVVFLGAKEDVDLRQVEAIGIEWLRDQKYIFYSSRSDSALPFKIWLLTENWGGYVKISNLVCPAIVPVGSDLEISLDIEPDPGEPGGLVKNIAGLAMRFRTQGGGSSGIRTARHFPSKGRDAFPSEVGQKATIIAEYDDLVFSDWGSFSRRRTVCGRGDISFYITYVNSEEVVLGNGNLTIVNTMSNVLTTNTIVECLQEHDEQ